MADKIDMSLDDIIKLNTSKRGSRGGRSQRGRGGFGRRGLSRGRGHWANKSSVSIKRGQGRISTRSRGSSRNFRSLSRPTSAPKGTTSPLNRKTINQKTNFKTRPQKTRGIRRGAPSSRFSEGKRVLRGSRGGRIRIRGGRIGGSVRGRQGGMQQMQKQAIQALRKAKTTLSKINAQVRRHNFVSTKRGLPQQQQQQSSLSSSPRNTIKASWSNRSRMRGRGRSFQNRFIPSKLNRKASNSLLSLKSNTSQQTIRHFGSTTSLNTQTTGRKRAWRDNSIQKESPKIMTISVSNSTRVQNNRSSNMRPHIGTQNLNFGSGIFAQGSTGVSLNDRFTSSEGSSSSVIVNSQERKVFF